MLATAGFDKVWLVGEAYKNCQLSIINCQLFNDVEEVKAAIAQEQPQHYYILIKGSNSVKLYQLPELL
jgi:UDP-N-acetylmuramoyl-tripeptide--D-alanyl-D-alanine ligase